ncbi:MAG: hypothetical protein KGJ79_09930 [Alphaproteobacteria bacterium]|nr:hypothetical protein [Alphaproteobacteria bacterium]MDE2111449.1 hypothetical protein [Alphaproteobacteria bacterium]
MTRQIMLAGTAVAAIACMLSVAGWGGPSGHRRGDTGSFRHDACMTAGNANMIVCKPGHAGFSEALGDRLLQLMPDKKKAVLLQTSGVDADRSIGDQVRTYLAKHGYAVRRAAIGMMGPPQDDAFTPRGSPYRLTIEPPAGG